ncbi:(2Fe-2S)-binding protein, partial [Streptomyces sp. C]|uniref:(2Fe-2S)-binding protein n=1 Tax=Streptomyces sp. C TaxID=253839 RepID=UPI0001B582F1
CRCEEVPADRIREAVEELGARDARTVKLLTRAGMGWCQGRMCGPAVAALAGGAQAPDRRPLSCPVPLRHLAALEPQAPRQAPR